MKSASAGASPIKLYWLYGGDLWVVSPYLLFDSRQGIKSHCGRDVVCYRSRCGMFNVPGVTDWVTMSELRELGDPMRRIRWPEILGRSVLEGLKWVYGLL